MKISLVLSEAKESSALKIANDMDHSVPVFRSITIKDRHQTSDSKHQQTLDLVGKCCRAVVGDRCHRM